MGIAGCVDSYCILDGRQDMAWMALRSSTAFDGLGFSDSGCSSCLDTNWVVFNVKETAGIYKVGNDELIHSIINIRWRSLAYNVRNWSKSHPNSRLIYYQDYHHIVGLTPSALTCLSYSKHSP